MLPPCRRGTLQNAAEYEQNAYTQTRKVVHFYHFYPFSRAKSVRKLKFWDNVHPTPHVTFNMSLVTCHVSLFNILGVAGAVLQTPSSLNNFVSLSAFSSQSSRYHKSQTTRARGLTFWENVHPLQHVTCHVSRVTCHMSHVTLKKNGQSGEAYWWRVCYQRGLTSLVFLSVLDKVVLLVGGGSVINGVFLFLKNIAMTSVFHMPYGHLCSFCWVI